MDRLHVLSSGELAGTVHATSTVWATMRCLSGSMMVPVLAMHMAVRDLFLRRRAHAGHAQAELERLARERVIAVEDHLRALDLHHVEDLRLALVVAALELAADLDAGREIRLRDGAQQRLVALAEGIAGRQVQRGLEARFLALQRGLDLGEGV